MTSAATSDAGALTGGFSFRPTVASPRPLIHPATVDAARRTLAGLLRHRQSEIAAEITREIQEGVPAFRRPYDETYQRRMQKVVEKALSRFADLLEHGHDTDQSWRELYESIGAEEMREGRSLDALHAAIRIAARVAWRRLIKVVERGALPLTALGPLTDAVYSHFDDLVGASTAGHAKAQAAEVGEPDRRRKRLLELLLADPPVSMEALTAAASAARWPLPRRLAAVTVAPGPGASGSPLLSPEILVDFDRPHPCLIVPDPGSPAQVRMLVNGLSRFRAAVGPPVAPARAAKSLRWARRAWDLANRGVIPQEGIVWCSEHLATLAVFQDDDLLATLVESRLAPLARLRGVQREALTDTLLAWLQLNMNANEVAARLHVHPQTVRHRLRQIARLFGDQMRDPDLRFELEIALRAEQARRTAAAASQAQ